MRGRVIARLVLAAAYAFAYHASSSDSFHFDTSLSHLNSFHATDGRNPEKLQISGQSTGFP